MWQIENIRICHIFRETNGVGDFTSKLATPTTNMMFIPTKPLRRELDVIVEKGCHGRNQCSLKKIQVRACLTLEIGKKTMYLYLYLYIFPTSCLQKTALFSAMPTSRTDALKKTLQTFSNLTVQVS